MNQRILLIFTILPMLLLGQTNDDRINRLTKHSEELSNRIENLTKEISNLKEINTVYKSQIEANKENLSTQLDIISNSDGNVSNKLSVLDTTISTWGIILSFLGLLVSIYVGWTQNRMKDILKKSQEILKDQEVIESDVQILKTSIEGNLDELFRRLHNKELQYIFRRIITFPKDIDHFFPKLAGYALEGSHYKEFKNVCISVNEKGDEFSNELRNLLIIMFQHFPHQLLSDSDLDEIYQKHFSHSASNGIFYDAEVISFLNAYFDLRVSSNIDQGFDKLKVLLKGKNNKSNQSKMIVNLLVKNLNHTDLLLLYRSLNTENQYVHIISLLNEEFKEISTDNLEMKQLIDKLNTDIEKPEDNK